MKAIKAFSEGSAIQPSTLTAFFYATKVIIYSQIKENSKENFMKTTKRQTFYLEGNVYSYRITKSALLRYEQASGRKIMLSTTSHACYRMASRSNTWSRHTAKATYGHARTGVNTPCAAYAHFSYTHDGNSSE